MASSGFDLRRLSVFWIILAAALAALVMIAIVLGSYGEEPEMAPDDHGSELSEGEIVEEPEQGTPPVEAPAEAYFGTGEVADEGVQPEPELDLPEPDTEPVQPEIVVTEEEPETVEEEMEGVIPGDSVIEPEASDTEPADIDTATGAIPFESEGGEVVPLPGEGQGVEIVDDPDDTGEEFVPTPVPQAGQGEELQD